MKTTKESSNGTNRKTAIIVGVLFILGFAGAFGPIFTNPILDDPNYLAKLTENNNLVMAGALAQLIMALACSGIAVGLYPVLKKHNEPMALGAVVFRAIENVIQIVAALALLSMLTLGQAAVKASALAAPAFQAAGASLNAVHFWSALVLGHFSFCIGAWMYYYVFFRSNLIPRWLSGWGLVAITLHLIAAFITMFTQTDPFSTSTSLMSIPVGLNELALSGWLIVKGFNPSAIASRFDKTAANEILSQA